VIQYRPAPDSGDRGSEVPAPAHLAPQPPAVLADPADLQLFHDWVTHQTLHDVKTGLPNRQHFFSRLERVLARLEPSAVVTLLHLDLDGFSMINDGLGDQAGDQVLEVVGQRLRTVVADRQAMVGRIGGDEFAILIEPEDPVPNVAALAETINTRLAEPISLPGTEVALTATIGVVQQQGAGTAHAELLRAAGATLHRVRGRAKRQWALFDADIDAAERVEFQLAAQLPAALANGELRVQYQPVVSLDTGWPVAVQALLSWGHPQHGPLSAERCAHVAEQTGAGYAVGRWLLRTAAEQAVSWQRDASHPVQPRGAGPVPPVVVNLTPRQAQDPDLVATVRAVLVQTGLAPAGLELRVPVGAIRTVPGLLAGEGGEQAEDNLKVLTELGVPAGLCDFGGGIGGLRCLAELPVGAVQVAQPVSRQVADDPSRLLSQAVHALVHLVREAGINVIAYPVDSREQAGCWQWVGANWAVGALFGPPGPPEHIERLLDVQSSR
jgi:diguanylate cyclase (GGDEF)-like protein